MNESSNIFKLITTAINALTNDKAYLSKLSHKSTSINEDLDLSLHELEKIRDAGGNNQTLIENLNLFLKNRWERIKNLPFLDYTRTADLKITHYCHQFAINVNNFYSSNCAYQYLIRTLTVTYIVNHDGTQTPLDNFGLTEFELDVTHQIPILSAELRQQEKIIEQNLNILMDKLSNEAKTIIETLKIRIINMPKNSKMFSENILLEILLIDFHDFYKNKIAHFKHIPQSMSLKLKIQKIHTFLIERWDRIICTIYMYTHTPKHPLSIIYRDIARLIKQYLCLRILDQKEKNKISIDKILMNTLINTYDEVNFEHTDDQPLESFCLDSTNNYPMPYIILNQYYQNINRRSEAEKLLKNYYKSKDVMSTHDQLWLFNSTYETSCVHASLEEYDRFIDEINQSYPPRHYLEILQKELYEASSMKSGTELNTPQLNAEKAVVKFEQYLNSLSPTQRKAVLKLIAEVKDNQKYNTLESTMEIITGRVYIFLDFSFDEMKELYNLINPELPFVFQSIEEPKDNDYTFEKISFTRKDLLKIQAKLTEINTPLAEKLKHKITSRIEENAFIACIHLASSYYLKLILTEPANQKTLDCNSDLTVEKDKHLNELSKNIELAKKNFFNCIDGHSSFHPLSHYEDSPEQTAQLLKLFKEACVYNYFLDERNEYLVINIDKIFTSSRFLKMIFDKSDIDALTYLLVLHNQFQQKYFNAHTLLVNLCNHISLFRQPCELLNFLNTFETYNTTGHPIYSGHWRSSNDKNLLHLAIIAKDMGAIEKIYKECPMLLDQMEEEYQSTPFIFSILMDYVPAVEYFLKTKIIDLNTIDSDYRKTSLGAAMITNNPTMINLLIQHGAQLKLQTIGVMNEQSNNAAIEYLQISKNLKTIANDKFNELNENLLHIAVKWDFSIDYFEKLVSADADITATNTVGLTPILLAYILDKQKYILYFNSKFQDYYQPNLEFINPNSQEKITFIQMMLNSVYPPSPNLVKNIKSLVTLGFKLFPIDFKDFIRYSTEIQQYITEELLKNATQFKNFLQHKDQNGHTLLHVAIYNEFPNSLIEQMITLSGDHIADKNTYGYTPFATAVLFNKASICCFSAHLPDNFDPYLEIVNPDFINIDIDQKLNLDVNTKPKINFTNFVFKYASKNYPIEDLKKFVNKIIDCNPEFPDIHLANIQHLDNEVKKYIIEKFTLHTPNLSKISSFDLIYLNDDIRKYVLDAWEKHDLAKSRIINDDSCDGTLLHISVMYKFSIDFIKKLVSLGADIHQVSNRGYTPIAHAFIYNHKACIQYFSTEFANKFNLDLMVKRPDYFSESTLIRFMSALFMMSEQYSEDDLKFIFKTLDEQNIKVSIHDFNFTSNSNKTKILKILSHLGLLKQYLYTTDSQGNSWLHSAVADDFPTEFTEFLLISGANIACKNIYGHTPFTQALIWHKRSYIACFTPYLPKEIDFNEIIVQRSNSILVKIPFNTYLFKFCHDLPNNELIEILKTLLCCGLKISVNDLVNPEFNDLKMGVCLLNALNQLAKEEKLNTLKFIDENKIKDIAPKIGSILHAAIQFNFPLKTIEYFLNVGADINAVNQFGQTPLALAVELNNVRLIEYFTAPLTLLLFNKTQSVFDETNDKKNKHALIIIALKNIELNKYSTIEIKNTIDILVNFGAKISTHDIREAGPKTKDFLKDLLKTPEDKRKYLENYYHPLSVTTFPVISNKKPVSTTPVKTEIEPLRIKKTCTTFFEKNIIKQTPSSDIKIYIMNGGNTLPLILAPTLTIYEIKLHYLKIKNFSLEDISDFILKDSAGNYLPDGKQIRDIKFNRGIFFDAVLTKYVDLAEPARIPTATKNPTIDPEKINIINNLFKYCLSIKKNTAVANILNTVIYLLVHTKYNDTHWGSVTYAALSLSSKNPDLEDLFNQLNTVFKKSLFYYRLKIYEHLLVSPFKHQREDMQKNSLKAYVETVHKPIVTMMINGKAPHYSMLSHSKSVDAYPALDKYTKDIFRHLGKIHWCAHYTLNHSRKVNESRPFCPQA